MNFFQEIFDLADDIDLSIRIKRKGATLTISVLPATGTGNALVVTGTPQELADGFQELIARPIADVKTIITNAETFKKSAEEAASKKAPKAAPEKEKAEKKKPAKDKPKKAKPEKSAEKEQSGDKEQPKEESAQPTMFD